MAKRARILLMALFVALLFVPAQALADASNDSVSSDALDLQGIEMPIASQMIAQDGGDDDDSDDEGDFEDDDELDILFIGSWGSCTYTIDNLGVLTIESGEGEDTNGVCPWDTCKEYIKKVVCEPGVIAPADCTRLFAGLNRCEAFILTNLDTTNTTNMIGMFIDCSNARLIDLSSWNTANVTDMSYMFDDCSALMSLDLSAFNTANVQGISSMFKGCSHLRTLDISSFDTSGMDGTSLANRWAFDLVFYGCEELISIKMGPAVAKAHYSNLMGAYFPTSQARPWYAEGPQASALATWDAILADVSNRIEAAWFHRVADSSLGPVSIGATSYDTLAAALADAQDYDVIDINQDLVITQQNAAVMKKLTIDMHGHCITYSPNGDANATTGLFISLQTQGASEGSLYLTSSGSAGNVLVACQYAVFAYDGARFTVDNVNIANNSGWCCGCWGEAASLSTYKTTLMGHGGCVAVLDDATALVGEGTKMRGDEYEGLLTLCLSVHKAKRVVYAGDDIRVESYDEDYGAFGVVVISSRFDVRGVINQEILMQSSTVNIERGGVVFDEARALEANDSSEVNVYPGGSISSACYGVICRSGSELNVCGGIVQGGKIAAATADAESGLTMTDGAITKTDTGIAGYAVLLAGGAEIIGGDISALGSSDCGIYLFTPEGSTPSSALTSLADTASVYGENRAVVVGAGRSFAVTDAALVYSAHSGVVNQGGTVAVNGGLFICDKASLFNSEGTITVRDGFVYSKECAIAVKTGMAEVFGGTISANIEVDGKVVEQDAIATAGEGVVKIHGGYFSSKVDNGKYNVQADEGRVVVKLKSGNTPFYRLAPTDLGQWNLDALQGTSAFDGSDRPSGASTITYAFAGTKDVAELGVRSSEASEDGFYMKWENEDELGLEANKVSNAGHWRGTVLPTGKMTGSGTVRLTISPYAVDEASVGSPADVVYTGAEQRPGVTVKGPNGCVLEEGTDYTLAYSDNVNVGTATVKVTCKGNYSGEFTRTFAIRADSGGKGGGGEGGTPNPGGGDDGSAPAAGIKMHRLYNPNSYEHFYTANDDEFANLVSLGWRDEGYGWTAPATGNSVYRLYNPNYGGDHHYTTDEDERDMLIEAGWIYEGVGWCSAPAEGGVPVYREYNPNELSRNHNYTADRAEHNNLVGLGWHDEFIAWYGV